MTAQGETGLATMYDTVHPLEGEMRLKLRPGASLLGEDELRELRAVISSRCLSRDYGHDRHPRTVDRFETAFAQKVGTDYALAVTSGTAALKVALIAAGVGFGDEVILPACTFIASAGAILQAGAVPIFAEIDESLTLDPDDIEKRLTPHTKAIMPVHLSGVPCQMDRIMEIARARGLKVIEDCAQSCGTTYQGRPIGAWGDFGAFSLQYAKIITAGEGGAITTNDPLLHERAVRHHDNGTFREGWRTPGDFAPRLEDLIGDNYRMNELNGAIAVAQIAKLDDIVARMKALYVRFRDAVTSIEGLRLRPVNDEEGHFGSRWALSFDDVEACARFAQALRDEGLKPGVPYGTRPLYMRESFLKKRIIPEAANPWEAPLYKGKAEYYAGLCPKSEDILKRVLIVMAPNPHYGKEEVDRVIRAVRNAAKKAL